MIPNAVHICHCIVNAPRNLGGEHSAAKMGVVADLGPMPNPRKNLAMNICHQVSQTPNISFWEPVHEEEQAVRYSLVKPCQKHASAEMRQLSQTVPRRPNLLFMGSVSQQPMKAQQR